MADHAQRRAHVTIPDRFFPVFGRVVRLALLMLPLPPNLLRDCETVNPRSQPTIGVLLRLDEHAVTYEDDMHPPLPAMALNLRPNPGLPTSPYDPPSSPA